MSYAASTLLFDRTESEGNPPRFTMHVVDTREPVTTRFFPTPRIPKRDEQFRIDYGRRYDRPWCLGHLSPVARNKRKLKARYKDRATTRHENGDGDRAAGSQTKSRTWPTNGQPPRYFPPWPVGVVLGSSSRSDLGGDTLTPMTDSMKKSDLTLRATAPECLPGSRDPGSIAASGPARRGARIRGQ